MIGQGEKRFFGQRRIDVISCQHGFNPLAGRLDQILVGVTLHRRKDAFGQLHARRIRLVLALVVLHGNLLGVDWRR
ncbi:hypothetical protein D3C81_2041520 [compost metagenome]